MANYIRLGITPVYVGAAADIKPASCNTGSRCYEHDTNKWYITYNAGTNWVEMQDLNALILGAGSALIGKVGIDQTTPGTTNRVDVGAALPAGTNAIGKVGHDATGIGHGVMTVTTAGTDLVLAASTACKMVIIQAQTDNTTGIAVGASGVDATIATGTGVFLYPGESVTLMVDNLADVYVDALTNGEGVRYIYFT